MAFLLTGDPVAAVPEPSTYAMIGLGLVGFKLARRR
ncbi:PEP-CTERM sorting domain-containing protein [Bryobacter aggregatus]